MYAGEGNHTPAPQTIHTSNGRRMYAREGNHTPAPQTTCMRASGEVQCERLRVRGEVCGVSACTWGKKRAVQYSQACRPIRHQPRIGGGHILIGLVCDVMIVD
jgi:hypothetical protein